eukprot:TRINITY_DN3295_c3_g7_i1.p1 TRINITY_DN3295_c3_g7~~TRINITY_DN3295_c3_g7_i1.p1  ORF type:complete len:324 (-),score=83.37 TRINITY_DN3295_c3_g7_i1:138-968(-)
MTLLFISVLTCKNRFAIDLLNYNADPFISCVNDITAFDIAIESVNYHVVRAISRKFKDKIMKMDTKTRLLCSAMNNDETFVNLLEITQNIDFNSVKTKKYDLSLLHLAVISNNLKNVEILLDHHTDVDMKDKMGNPALFYAFEIGNIEMIELLLAYGADPQSSNFDGIGIHDLSLSDEKVRNFAINVLGIKPQEEEEEEDDDDDDQIQSYYNAGNPFDEIINCRFQYSHRYLFELKKFTYPNDGTNCLNESTLSRLVDLYSIICLNPFEDYENEEW